MRYAICDVQYAIYNMRYAICDVQYTIQYNIFVANLADTIANFKEFLENFSFNSVNELMLPYFVAISLVHIANMIVAETTPKIKLNAVQTLTEKLLALNKSCNLKMTKD